MGNCISSKEPNRKYLHSTDVDDDAESQHIVSLTSSTYGLLNMERGSPSQGSFLSFHRRSKKYQAIAAYDDFVFSAGLDAEHVSACKNMLKMRGDNEQDSLLLQNDSKVHGMETINAWELMEGLDEECGGNNKLRSPNKPISAESTHASNSSLVESDAPVWKKYYIESETVKEGLIFCHISPKRTPSSPFNESPRMALACMPFVKSLTRLPSCSSLIEPEDSRSVSSAELPDGGPPGLKLLLSPAKSPSYYARPLTKRAGIHAASLSFDGNTDHLRKASHVKSKRSLDLKKRCSRQQSMDSSKGSDAPLFDPLLMATFEQAVMVTSKCSHDDWLRHSMDEVTTNSSSSDNTWPSSEMASDAESIPHWHKQEKGIFAHTISSVDEEKEDVTGFLTKYEVRCPPQGDGKVVLYHTSLRGVRKTYEDCCTVRLILKGLGVHVEERDVWMHAKFKEELLDVLGDSVKGVPLVPRLFIKGRYIGGAEEVKQLHENGSLACFMDGIAMDMFHSVCDGCGDVRFVPCLECSGSCKVRDWNNEVSRCLVCNENGLIMCPICTA